KTMATSYASNQVSRFADIADEMMTKAKTVRSDCMRYLDVNKEPDVILPPIPIATSQTHKDSLSLLETIKRLEHLINDLQGKVKYSLEKCKNPKQGLSQDESAALYLYSLQWPNGQHSLYSMFNCALRDEDRTKLVPFQDYYNLFMSALKKLPSIQEQVWRGVNGDLSKKYHPGTVHVWWGASSCTDMVKVTDTFLNETIPRTLFNIKCFNGKNIIHHSDFPNERETILAPGTYLKVRSQSNPAPNFHIVDCEQIEPIVKYLLWLTPNINQSQDNLKLQEKLHELFPDNFRPYEKEEECEMFIDKKKNDEILLIVTGQIGRHLVPKLHDLLQLRAVFVYCMDKGGNQKWSKNFPKVTAVVVRLKELIQEVEKEMNKPILAFEGGSHSEPDELPASNNNEMHIRGYEKMPLVSIEEAVQPLHTIVPDVQRLAVIAKRHCGDEEPKDGLSKDESAAIMLYTMEWETSLYCILNQTLRSEHRNNVKPWFSYLKLVLTALRKLPSFEGVVWRGVRADLSQHHKQGEPGVWWGFTTATMNANVLGDEMFLGKTGKRTLFSIQCKDGKRIGSHSSYPQEEEILLLPGFSYQVVSVLQTAPDMHMISLKEIGVY
ncbi:unnamed protein product, partial [Rotaria magnacalcarata]